MDIKSANIVFFSGTGGTRRVAESLKTAFQNRQIDVSSIELNSIQKEMTKADLLVVLFPVYACNAPLPINEWIADAPFGNGMPTVVISASGGGDVTPNTACRVACIKKLKSKGYDVIYEKMLTTPSNWITPSEDSAVMLLLHALPVNSQKIVDDVLAGKNNKTKPKALDRFLSKIAVIERKGAKRFGRNIKISDSCTGCSLCSKKCPRANITMKDGKPVFGDRCVICLKCIYGCPQKALQAGIIKFVVIKKGFNIESVEKKMQGVTDFPPIEELCKGYIWSGVRKYLLETEELKKSNKLIDT